jgi:hypothetical protein
VKERGESRERKLSLCSRIERETEIGGVTFAWLYQEQCQSVVQSTQADRLISECYSLIEYEQYYKRLCWAQRRERLREEREEGRRGRYLLELNQSFPNQQLDVSQREEQT